MALVNINDTAEKFMSYQQVYADTHSYRFLPYSIVFDLLSYFKDLTLNQKICTAFQETLPHRDHYSSDIDLWIDLEMVGNITVIMAKALATIVTDFITQLSAPIVISITSDKKLTKDNEIFLYYCQQLCPQIEIISCKPGDFKPFDEAYLQWQCFKFSANSDYTDNVESILHHAWLCAELGADEVAFKIMECGIRKARIFYLKQLYLLQLQFMRIASQQYTAAADEIREVTKDFQVLYPTYHLTKAWGSVLLKRLDAATRHFDLAEVNMKTHPTDLESLYRLNIFALLQHLNGDTSNAFIIENLIHNALEKSETPHPQLSYVNAINLARLYRSTQDYSLAKKLYDKAFQIVRMKKSESDLIYSQLCYGKLYEKQKKFDAALEYYLQAVSVWLRTKTPEALSLRVIRALAIEEVKPRDWLEPRWVDAAFIKKIVFLAEHAGLRLDASESKNSRQQLQALRANVTEAISLMALCS